MADVTHIAIAGNQIVSGNAADNDTLDMVNAGASGSFVDLNAGLAFSSATGVDTLISIENIRGSEGNDGLFGNAAANIFYGTGGFDVIDGRGGIDTFDASGVASAVAISLEAGVVFGGASGTLTSIENAVGSAFDDAFVGSTGVVNVLSGGAGSDSFGGLDNGDTVDGGSGTDTTVLTGNSGDWTLSFSGSNLIATNGVDTLTLTGVENLAFGDLTVRIVGANSEYSIQDAVDAANGGDIVLIAPDTYVEDVTISNKAISIVGSGAVTVQGQFDVSDHMEAGDVMRFENILIDATGKQYGIRALSSATDIAGVNEGSIVLDGVSISNASDTGFFYANPSNIGTPTNTNTVGSISILNSDFADNAQINGGHAGQSHVNLFGFNGNLTVDTVTFTGPATSLGDATGGTPIGETVNPRKAMSVTGVRTGTPGEGGYVDAGVLTLNDITVTGNYSTDVISFYTIQSFSSSSITDVEINARGPWGLINFDSVGGSVDLSGVSGTNSHPGGLTAVMQGLNTAESFTGNDGNDMLDGRAGADVLNGGDGNDVFRIANTAHHAGDTIDGGDGTDAIWFASNSGGSLVLGSSVTNIEEVRLVSGHAAYSPADVTAKNVDASAVGNALDIHGNAGANEIVGTAFGDNIFGNAGDDVITGGGGDDVIDGGAGMDTATYASAYSSGMVTWDGTTASVSGADGDSSVTGVEKLVFSGGQTVWLVGKGSGHGLTEIADLFDGDLSNGEAADGDQILVAEGTYSGNFTVDKEVTIVGMGDAEDIVIDSGYSGNAAEHMRTTGGYPGASGAGITVAADNVTIKGLTINGFEFGVKLQVPGGGDDVVNNLTIEDTTIMNAWYGIMKGDGQFAGGAYNVGVEGLSVIGGLITQATYGIYLGYATPFTSFEARDITIDGTTFSDLNEKGIYAESLRGTTLFTDLTMTDVGHFGRDRTWSNPPTGEFGNGIDINLKFATYDSSESITIEGFDFTNVGTSAGADPTGHFGGAAIAIKGRDDPGHGTYGPNPAVTDDLVVLIQNGTIDGTSTGIRVGEPNKSSSANNVTGPAVTVENVSITGELENSKHNDVDNVSKSVLTINGTSGDDSYQAVNDDTSTGPILFNGGAGNDSFSGAGGDDTLNGGDDNDILEGGGGDDLLNGGAGNDTLDGGAGFDTIVYGGNIAEYSIAVDGGNIVITDLNPGNGDDGTDTVTNVESLQFGDSNVLIVGPGGGYSTIQAAIDASSDGDTIVVLPGLYIEDLNINKSVTILGAKAGVAATGRDPSDPSDEEATVVGHSTITSATGAVTIDGMRFLNDAIDAGVSTLGITSAFDHVVTNSVFYSTVQGGLNGVDDRAIFIGPLASGTITISNNYITGTEDGDPWPTFSWGRGIWFDGGGSDLIVTGNTIEYARSGINLDMSGTSTASVTNNTFLSDGSGVSLGVDQDGVTIEDNDFSNVGTDFNLRNLSGNSYFDADVAIATLTPASPAADVVHVLGGIGHDTLKGTEGSDYLIDNDLNGTAVDNDLLEGRGGDDLLQAKLGNDTLDGGEGDDTLEGGGGDDILIGGEGSDDIDGGAGIDTAQGYGAGATISIAGGKWTVSEGADTDTLSNVEKVVIGGTTFILVDSFSDGGFASLQAAIDEAEDGDVILVAPGVYNELTDYQGGSQIGLVVDKSVTIMGVDAAGAPITDANDVAADIVSGAQSWWGTNFFVTAPNVTITGLNFIAMDGPPYVAAGEVNKAFEIVADNFTLQYSKVGAADGVEVASTIYINDAVVPDDLTGFVSAISKYLIDSNILEGTFVTTNGPGYGIDAGDIDMVVSNNAFVMNPGSDAGYNWGILVTGKESGIPWRKGPAVLPAVYGNSFTSDYAVLFRGADDDAGNLPDRAYIDDFIANNAFQHYAFAVDSGTGEPRLIDFHLDNPYGAGDVDSQRFYVHDNAGTASADAQAGDTLIVKASGDTATVTLVTDDLIIDAQGSTADLDITLGSGVASVTLLGNENIDVTGNELANAIVGNDGDNELIGLGGNDTLEGGAGDDTLDGGADDDVLEGGEGDDILLGGDGSDRAVFSGNFADYSVVVDSGQITVTDNQAGDGDDGTDTLTGVETLVFDDVTVHVVGDGGFATIAEALAAAEDDDIILVAADDYAEGALVVDKRVTILGANAGVAGNGLRGAESTLIGGLHILVAGVVIDGLRIAEGASMGGELAGIFVQNDDVEIRNVRFERSGTVDADAYRGIVTATGDGQGLVVENNYFTGWATGLYINPGSDAQVTDNVFERNWVGISTDGPAAGLLIQDNTFDNDFEQIGVGATEDPTDLSDKILANTFIHTLLPRDVSIYPLAGIEGEVIIGTEHSDVFQGLQTDVLLGQAFYGMGGNDVLRGGEGNDTLSGGSGADTLVGGNGNDTYIVEDALDTFTDTGGIDTIQTTLNSFTLVANIENLEFIGTGNFAGTGNGLNNVITGGDGNDNLNGGNGNDTIYGGDGDDQLSGGVSGSNGVDYLAGGKGNDTYILGPGAFDTIVELAGEGTDKLQSQYVNLDLNLYTNIENAKLVGTANLNATGDAFANRLEGNSGDNILTGGLGKDTLVGGEGADIFRFTDIADSPLGGLNRDIILDFEQGIDLISLLAIDAKVGVAGNNAFVWIGTDAFTGAGLSSQGQLRYEFSGANTLVSGDVNGDGVADFSIQVNGLHNLNDGDFIL